MKKFLTIAIFAVALFALMACNAPSDPISLDEFIQYFDAKDGFTLEAADGIDGAESYYIAYRSDMAVEYIKAPEGSSVAAYVDELVENLKGDMSGAVTTDVKMGSYELHTLTADGVYYVVAAIDNTVLIGNTLTDYKDELTTVFIELGYINE